MKMSKKANVKEVLAYSSTALLMYAGLVGIDAKAAEIEKIESHIENTVKSLYPSSKEKDTIKISEEEKGLETPFTKKGNVTQIISYVKGKRIDGYINFNEGIHYYIVDENAHLEIYDRYGIKQNTNDLNIKLVEIEKEEKERTNGRQAQFQQEVDEKASPKEGMQNFFKKFVSTFHLPEQYKDKAEIKMVLRFIVNENGTLSDIKAHNSENKDYVLHERDINKPNDSYYFEGLKAAILTLKQMPEWNPAMKGEKAVASNFTIPLTLKTGNPETSKDIYSNVEFDKKASPKEGLQKFYENVTDVMDLSELAANTRFTIEFVVETDGSLSDIRLKPSTALSKELSDKYQLLLTDAIRKTPKWIPAEKDGKPVRSDFVLPVSFEKINK